MSNSVEYIQARPDGETVKSTLTYVNENTSDGDVSKMVAALSSLSKNTLTAIERVEGEDIALTSGVISAKSGNKYTVINDNKKGNLNYSSVSYQNTQLNITNYVDGTESNPTNITLKYPENNKIYNTGNYRKILASNNSDTITNTGDYVSIFADYTSKQLSDDVIINSGNFVTISNSEGGGNVTVSNSGNNASINVRNGDNLVSNSGDNVSIYASLGNHEIDNSGDFAYISLSPYNTVESSISNSGDNVTIHGSSYSNFYSNSGDNVSIYAIWRGVQDDTVETSGKNVSINTAGGNDSVVIHNHPTAIHAASASDINASKTIIGFDPAQDYFYSDFAANPPLEWSAALNENNNAVVSVDEANGVINMATIELVGVNSGTIKCKQTPDADFTFLTISPYVPEES